MTFNGHTAKMEKLPVLERREKLSLH